MKYIKVILIYWGIMMVYGILFAIFPSEILRVVGRYIAPIPLLAALFHIGMIIPNKNVKKRYF
ncbi:MAG: hypothetical protein LBC73_11185, partial [Oscillospiraceae bacterium]|nr:hypothetical protein [Oscillospiraceae bacterium]